MFAFWPILFTCVALCTVHVAGFCHISPSLLKPSGRKSKMCDKELVKVKILIVTNPT